MDDTYFTSSEVAGQFRCSQEHIRRLASSSGIGIKIGRRGGWRFTEADVRQLADLMRPKPQQRRDKRRRSVR